MQKTLQGISLDDLRIKLDASLPETAYKKIGGTKLDLTDIDPGWMRRAFNSLFGLCGVGWGIDYDTADLVLDYVGENSKNPMVAIKKLNLWFMLVDENRNQTKHSVPATGSNVSQQGNLAYALKGAVTNAIGNAASQLGWQESIYLGYRSHDNVSGHAPVSTAKTPEPEKPAEKPVTTTTPATEPEKKAYLEEQSKLTQLAQEKANHFVCVKCGAIEVSFEKLVDCRHCGEKACLTDAGTLDGAKKASDIAKARKPEIPSGQTKESTATADEIKAAIEKAKSLLKAKGFSNLQKQFGEVSRILGRNVGSWADVLQAERLAVIKELEKSFETNATPPAPIREEKLQAPPMGRSQKLNKIFDMAGRIGCKNPTEATKEVSVVIGRTISGSAELTEEEIDTVLKNFTDTVVNLGL